MATQTVSLSKIDRNILKLLLKFGRMSYAEVGRRVGLTTTPCKERIKKLEASGVIRGYRADLDPKLLGAGLIVFVQVTLQRTSGDAFRVFQDAIEAIPEVEECHLVSGEFDYLIKARVADMGQYRDLLAGSLLQLPNVLESKSFPVMDTLVDAPAVTL